MIAEDAAILNVIMIVIVGVLGLVIGSFLNVVIYRVPQGMSVVNPPSACPHCGSHIGARDNVPVISWLLLRGKCRTCAEPISARYPIVELATGLLFAAAAYRFPLPYSAPVPIIIATAFLLVAFLYFAAISVALTGIDIDTHKLPNAIVLPAYPVVAILLIAASLIYGDYTQLLQAAIGGAILFAVYFLMALVYPGGMGFGDVKLAGVIGVILGFLDWGSLIIGAFAAFLLGGLFGIALLLTRKAGRKSGIPFGPWMLAGAWIGIFFGGRVWAGYLSLVGLA
ncbi:leader peptidase (prepilin peptidase)/N-methyltransferase [Conyzicola lurida]|uniref:Leader peptidase (Prepilin peptidase)/N-methyltransferase n=1 Tax=Conyzicola lurida TaxID=1172621 RepID=A0A841AEY8_9MICO|nr:A24 family peptidase [Conyzicola lurida]MBB5841807.1 leader peptidase (prepilin peptidase)/N-methyltransferase [Conyzicola lurida]